MDANVMAWVEALFRWTHVVAGIMWIGHLWFFNFVNAQLAKTYDADSKKKVIPELMPRALYWFRWGAAYTWVTGFVLVAMVYYMAAGGAGNLVRVDVATDQAVIATGAAMVISLALIVVVFFVYDAIWKAMAKNEKGAATLSFVLITVVLFAISRVFTGRAVFIHAGVLFGTIMAMNVWMRIWPAQKKIIQGVKGIAPAPDASVPALAGLRSKHNTYMSVPLVFSMVSNHYPTIYGWDHSWIIMALLILVGWGVTNWLYKKSASPAPARYGAPAAVPPPGATPATPKP